MIEWAAVKLWLAGHLLALRIGLAAAAVGFAAWWHLDAVHDAAAEARKTALGECAVAQVDAVRQALQVRAATQASLDAQALRDRAASDALAKAIAEKQATLAADMHRLAQLKPLAADCRADPERVQQVNAARGHR